MDGRPNSLARCDFRQRCPETYARPTSGETTRLTIPSAQPAWADPCPSRRQIKSCRGATENGRVTVEVRPACDSAVMCRGVDGYKARSQRRRPGACSAWSADRFQPGDEAIHSCRLCDITHETTRAQVARNGSTPRCVKSQGEIGMTQLWLNGGGWPTEEGFVIMVDPDRWMSRCWAGVYAGICLSSVQGVERCIDTRFSLKSRVQDEIWSCR